MYENNEIKEINTSNFQNKITIKGKQLVKVKYTSKSPINANIDVKKGSVKAQFFNKDGNVSPEKVFPSSNDKNDDFIYPNEKKEEVIILQFINPDSLESVLVLNGSLWEYYV